MNKYYISVLFENRSVFYLDDNFKLIDSFEKCKIQKMNDLLFAVGSIINVPGIEQIIIHPLFKIQEKKEVFNG